jgi:hypothetical protein
VRAEVAGPLKHFDRESRCEYYICYFFDNSEETDEVTSDRAGVVQGRIRRLPMLGCGFESRRPLQIHLQKILHTIGHVTFPSACVAIGTVRKAKLGDRNGLEVLLS